ncbi:hypothetical protein Q5P01_007412 [Channa striata]|uniref:C-type lectin domain-containing protein n=1 Tax=Channa striata TaxID=64152 RepID=A0AA88N8A9_CHASR|nr:hypothetical protein Q5P01_007412 [Channa striata]
MLGRGLTEQGYLRGTGYEEPEPTKTHILQLTLELLEEKIKRVREKSDRLEQLQLVLGLVLEDWVNQERKRRSPNDPGPSGVDAGVKNHVLKRTDCRPGVMEGDTAAVPRSPAAEPEPSGWFPSKVVQAMAPGLYFLVLLGLTSRLWAQPASVAGGQLALEDDECCKRCPSGWTQFGNKCYMFHFENKDWADAEVACVAVSGNLAPVHSQEQYTFIKDIIKRSTGSDVYTWVGGHDAAKEGVWLWTDGSKFDFKFWGKGEPNNSDKGENCLMINYDGHGNDISCQMKSPFICAKNL